MALLWLQYAVQRQYLSESLPLLQTMRHVVDLVYQLHHPSMTCAQFDKLQQQQDGILYLLDAYLQPHDDTSMTPAMFANIVQLHVLPLIRAHHGQDAALAWTSVSNAQIEQSIVYQYMMQQQQQQQQAVPYTIELLKKRLFPVKFAAKLGIDMVLAHAQDVHASDLINVTPK